MTQIQPNNVTPIHSPHNRGGGRKHPLTPVGLLFNEFGISLRGLDAMLGKSGFKTSPTMLSRFVNQTLQPEYMDKFAGAIAGVMRPFLVDQGLSKSQIDNRLSLIFTEGEYQPMISKRVALSDTECLHFGFIADVDGKQMPLDPFKNPPQTRDEVFFPPEYREIYDRVIDAIKYRHFVAVLGPIGSGKTTLRAMVEDHVASESNLMVIWPEFFDQAKISPYEIARTILRDCDSPVPGRSAALGKAVTGKLQSLTQNGIRVAVAFDECHKMHRDAIRSLKNFHEMSSGGFQKYLGIVLFGWPSFESMLSTPEFQEIYERVDVVEMPQFQTIARGYLEHRIEKLAGRRLKDLFDDEAIDLICSQSETPLGLGNIANEALRISMRDFENKKVIGKAIKTKMFFESPNRSLAFKKR